MTFSKLAMLANPEITGKCLTRASAGFVD